MSPLSFEGLLGVALIAFGAPLLLGLAPRLRVPAVVLEIVAGIVVGPSVLGWIQVAAFTIAQAERVSTLSTDVTSNLPGETAA